MTVSRRLRPYSWTLGAVGAATVLVYLGPDIFRAEGMALVFLGAVLASAYAGGMGPGIAAIPLSLLIAFGFFRTPAWDFANPDYLVSELSFIALSLLFTWLIAHRRYTERALRESEAQYRDLVQNANSAILRWRRDGTITFFNEYAQSFFGYSAEEVVGQHVSILLPARETTGNDLSGLIADIVAAPERYKQNINENVCKDGRRVWMIWTNRPVFDSKGEITEILAIGGDITERKRAEEAFQDSRLLLETIVTHMPAAACIIRGSDLRLQSVNPAYQTFAPGKQMLGFTLEEIWPETGRAFSVLCRQVLETGEPLHFFDEPYTIRRSPHSPLETAYFSWSLHRVPLPGEDGWGLLNTAWETTQRVVIEEALRQSEIRHRRLYESNLIGVLHFQLNGSITDANDHFLGMVGYSREDLRAGRIDWARMTPPEYRHQDEAAIALLRTTGEDIPYEKEYIRKDGSRIPILIGAALVDDSKEEGIAFVLDITERKNVEEELRKVNETLEQRVQQRTAELERSQDALKQSERLATIGEVMTGLSHESRNALQRGLVGIEILERRLNEQPALQHLVQEVRRAHVDLRRVYESVQDYARPILLERYPSDVAHAWRRAWESLTAREGRDATLREEIESNVRECEVDLSQMEQVFRNLFDNALAACPDPAEIRVHCQSVSTQSGPRLRIAVRDNGPGVPADQRKRIFDPFFTTKTKGTGLGLAIVQRIVEAHGGQIALNEQTVDGLEVVIDLPGRGVLNGSAAADCVGRRRGVSADVHGGTPD